MRIGTGSRPARNGRLTMSDGEYAELADLVKREFGLDLLETKRVLVTERMAPRVRATGSDGFGGYLRLVKSTAGAAEMDRLLSSLTTNVTQFFREAHHLDRLRNRELPALAARARSGGRVRIWSAGCSSGQEPYSIAMTVLDLLPEAGRLDVRILATDIDSAILARAGEATYSAAEIATLPESARKKFTLASENGQTGLRKEVRDLVTFRQLNLVKPLPFRGPFDAIFCRNVAIYFDIPTQTALWSRFADVMASGAILCLGHSERLTGPASDLLSHDGPTTYRRL